MSCQLYHQPLELWFKRSKPMFNFTCQYNWFPENNKVRKNWKILAGGLRETVIPMFTVKCLVLKKQGQDLTWLLTGVYDFCPFWLFIILLVCPTGGTGPTADSGWGCMLRCGQMILAEALIYRHLGRGQTSLNSLETIIIYDNKYNTMKVVVT